GPEGTWFCRGPCAVGGSGGRRLRPTADVAEPAENVRLNRAAKNGTPGVISCRDPEGRGNAMSWTKTPAHGGAGGNEFMDDLTLVDRLAGLVVRSGSAIDSLQCFFLMATGTT